MPFSPQPKLDYLYDTAIKTLTKASFLPDNQIPLGAMLMIGGISEPMPSSVMQVKSKLTELGYL